MKREEGETDGIAEVSGIEESRDVEVTVGPAGKEGVHAGRLIADVTRRVRREDDVLTVVMVPLLHLLCPHFPTLQVYEVLSLRGILSDRSQKNMTRLG